MTSDRRDNEDTRLESLYRAAGEVEPEAGLDRSIRARAREATHASSRRGFAPWIGGVATASVALVAITLAVRQPTPEPTAPPPQAEPQQAADDAAGAAFGDEADRSELGNAAASPEGESVAPAPALRSTPEEKAKATPDRERRRAPARETAQEPAPTVGGARIDESRDGAADTDDASRQSAAPTPGPAAGPDLDPEATIELIRNLVADGELQRAREMRAKLQKTHPDLELPQDLREALAEEGGE